MFAMISAIYLFMTATSAANARTAIGLGSMSTQDASNIDITGGDIGGTNFDGTGVQVLVDTPSSAGEAANKSYVDQQVGRGVIWSENVLVVEQLSDSDNSMLQAGAFYLANNAVDGDFLTIKGTLTRTYGFGSGGNVQVTIGGTAALTMQNLVDAINADGDSANKWSAVLATDLNQINSSGGKVVVIYRKSQTAADADRMYGTFATQADAKYVNYHGLYDYRSTTSATLPTSDPGELRFGPGRVQASLSDGEAHLIVSGNEQFSWNNSDGVWVRMDIGALVAGNGLTQSANTWAVGAGNGIVVNANDVAVDFSDTGGDFLADAATGDSGVSNKAARADHVHPLNSNIILKDGSVAMTGKLQTAGRTISENNITSAASLLTSKDVNIIDGGGGAFTVKFPAATGSKAECVVRRFDQTNAGVNIITLQKADATSDTIEDQMVVAQTSFAILDGTALRYVDHASGVWMRIA